MSRGWLALGFLGEAPCRLSKSIEFPPSWGMLTDSLAASRGVTCNPAAPAASDLSCANGLSGTALHVGNVAQGLLVLL